MSIVKPDCLSLIPGSNATIMCPQGKFPKESLHL